jgi:FKBP-type peptidyl-prolyl cis-trans isomerase
MKWVRYCIAGAVCALPLGCGPKPAPKAQPLQEPTNRVIMVEPPDQSSGAEPANVQPASPKDLAEEKASNAPPATSATTPPAATKPAETNKPAAPAKTTPTVSAPPAPTAPPKVENMTTLSSGLKYRDLVAGKGPSPKNGQTVTVQYTGWLMNGKKFDSSYDHGQPFEFRLGAAEVIPGWDVGVATMKVGGTRVLVIPPAMAYGPEGSPPAIPANATLEFQVSLLGVK